jgi:hypothetical protein
LKAALVKTAVVSSGPYVGFETIPKEELEEPKIDLPPLVPMPKPKPEPKPETKWLDIDNWRKIKFGMDVSSVELLLGSPTRVTGSSPYTYFYYEGRPVNKYLSGSVTFRNQKVNNFYEPSF